MKVSLADILSRLESPDEAERMQGLLDLVQAGGPPPLDLLFRLASEDPSPGVRYHARRAFAAFRAPTPPPAATSERPAPAERPAAPDDPRGPSDQAPPEPSRPVSPAADEAWQRDLAALDPARRLAAARQAVEAGARAPLPWLIQALSRESAPEVRAALVAAIGHLGGPEQVEVLAPYLADRDHRVRANAVEALAAIGSDEAIVRLIPLIHDPDHRVQANALRALAGIEGTSIPRLLRHLAQDGELWNRDAALHALDVLGAPFALHLLAAMAANDPVARLRQKARAALERHAAAASSHAGGLARHLLERLPPAT
ncbi:MAG: hypothetical protein OZSIB_3787 [Candidatus Ozemobacter sibiricus]|uniref:HEAT repeat domain-containing protein n=1 Tax=Candidatus Ozemobacter sibiricus TaxID=2268124 RepID=A0A367ZP62_9BACT|nr:MAG: hypothetical protein OZSIB_3787 [Candidatus Ozemobacter sibiricus]